MNRKFNYSILAVVILITVIGYNLYLDYKDQLQTVTEGIKIKGETNSFFLPKSTTGQVVHHHGYSLSYSERYEQAEWVAYELKKSHLSNTNFKRPYFEQDKSVKTASAHWKNYKRSGYDRGHLCPAGDRKHRKDLHDETFLTSNITPQKHDFNSGIWTRLEQKVRYWAIKFDGVYVVTGGILNGDLPTIGEEEVAVPYYFYKVLIDYNNDKPKTIAFVIEHKTTTESLDKFVVPVDTVERLTGIDFFPKLEDNLEEALERSSNYKEWF